MSEQAGEKTFAPSTKRRQDAARKGDVLRSRELATAAAVMVGAVWLRLAGPWVYGGLDRALRAGFTWDRTTLEHFDPTPILLGLIGALLPPVMVLGVAILIASVISQLGFSDGRFVAANLAPKASRLNPASGFKRMFGPNGLIELGKGLLKVLLLGSIAAAWGYSRIGVLIALGRTDLAGQLAVAWHALTSLLFVLAAGLLLIALVDLPVQWIRRMGRLKMTLQEVRDEHKESEGSPENKAAVRDRQRKIAMGSVAGAMREAQFVVTNPAHFAIAMTYDPGRAAAPIVLAKGRGEKALAMRELAAELAVPVLEYPALARSLYYTTREHQMIREELYAAVASVLAFVMSLKRGEPMTRPEIEVPTTLRFDTDGRLDPRPAR